MARSQFLMAPEDSGDLCLAHTHTADLLISYLGKLLALCPCIPCCTSAAAACSCWLPWVWTTLAVDTRPADWLCLGLLCGSGPICFCATSLTSCAGLGLRLRGHPSPRFRLPCSLDSPTTAGLCPLLSAFLVLGGPSLGGGGSLVVGLAGMTGWFVVLGYVSRIVPLGTWQWWM